MMDRTVVPSSQASMNLYNQVEIFEMLKINFNKYFKLYFKIKSLLMSGKKRLAYVNMSLKVN